jgi:hypothetical protein
MEGRMSTVVSSHACVKAVEVSDAFIIARLSGGRTIRFPLSWSRRLADATPEQRSRYELVDGGLGVRWPDVDEDISVRGMLEGRPGRHPRR